MREAVDNAQVRRQLVEEFDEQHGGDFPVIMKCRGIDDREECRLVAAIANGVVSSLNVGRISMCVIMLHLNSTSISG